MILRALAITALVAGASTLLPMPAPAQSGSLKLPPRTQAGPSDSAGTTNKVPDNNNSSTETRGTTGTGTANGPGASGQGMMNRPGGAAETDGIANSQRHMQGNLDSQMDSRPPASGPGRTWDDTPERQMTECLNNAAAQRMSFDTCRR